MNTRRIQYGDNLEVRLALDDDYEVTHCLVIGEPLDDPAAAVAAALSSPEGFPPISSACVPGDHVVIALDGDVPRPEALVSGTVHALREGGAEMDIEVVCAQAATAKSLQSLQLKDVVVSVHDPNDEKKLTYLAASKEGQPIYFSRALHDADVVIPIGVMRPEDSFGYVGVSGALFPAFSDTATRERFQAPSSVQHAVHRRRRREEAAEAAWLLGIQFTIQVVPGPDGSVLHVLAGDCQCVEKRGRKLCDTAWTFKTPSRAPLVIAAIDGADDQQTWENFARALQAAKHAADDGADIVLCTTLQCEPGPALLHLATETFGDEVLRDLTRRKSPDAAPATVLFDVLQSYRIHLLSGLPHEFVEGLGLRPVGDEEEIERLAQEHRQCTIISSAHRAAVTP